MFSKWPMLTVRKTNSSLDCFTRTCCCMCNSKATTTIRLATSVYTIANSSASCFRQYENREQYVTGSIYNSARFRLYLSCRFLRYVGFVQILALCFCVSVLLYIRERISDRTCALQTHEHFKPHEVGRLSNCGPRMFSCLKH